MDIPRDCIENVHDFFGRAGGVGVLSFNRTTGSVVVAFRRGFTRGLGQARACYPKPS